MRHSFLGQFAFALSLLVLPLTCSAAEIIGSSKITKVTVFPNGAQVTREFSVDVPVGAHEIVLKDLPSRLQGNSLRVEGAGLQGLQINTLDQKVITLPLGSQEMRDKKKQLQAELDRLLDERTIENAQIQAADLQKKLLNEMAMLPSRQIRRGDSEGSVDLSAQYSNLYTLMGDKFIEAQKRSLQAQIKIRALDKEIKNVKRRLAERPRGKSRATQLVVNVSADQAGTSSFTVRYQVTGAGWRPLYEARLDTGSGTDAKLNVVRRASIFQRTSEDWDNVALTLSTTNPTGRTNVPTISPWFVDFRPDLKTRRPAGYLDSEEDGVVDVRREKTFSRKLRSAKIMKPKVALGLGAVPAAAPAPVRVSFGAYQMTFDVVKPTSVKRSGEYKKVFLDAFDVKPKVSLETVPFKDRKAYLQASFENKTGNALLAGKTALFRDGVYVGSTHLKVVEPGQKTEFGFGVDSKVNVKWVRLDRVKGKTGLITSSNSDVHRYKITITNGHKWKMPVRVFDRMPYAEQEDIKITLLDTNPNPSSKNIDDKLGVMAWDLIVEPNKPLEIKFGYQLVWPKDKKITLR